jgi:C terminal of Calcineurin-like phosphoesterase/Phosphate transporter family
MFNLFGVLLSLGAVAFGIVSLLPVELTQCWFCDGVRPVGGGVHLESRDLVFRPSGLKPHTLIGSIIDVGITNALLHGRDGTSGVDWSKATEIGYALLLSPLFGFVLAAILLLLLKFVVRNAALYSEPKGEQTWWIRGILVITKELYRDFRMGQLLGSPLPCENAFATNLIVSFFDGGPRTLLEYRIGKREAVKMERVVRPDPFVEEVFARNEATKKPWVKAEPSSHIWMARLPDDLESGTHCIAVRAIDEYGREHRDHLVVELTASDGTEKARPG